MRSRWNKQVSLNELATAEVLAFRSDHDLACDRLGPEDAPAVREALGVASQLRASGWANEAERYLAAMTLERLVEAV